jgi:hypothetical protein
MMASDQRRSVFKRGLVLLSGGPGLEACFLTSLLLFSFFLNEE